MNKRKNCKIIFCFSIIIIVSGIQGDEWFFDSKTNDYAFGKTKIVQQIDASKSRAWPVFTLCIYYKDKLMAKYKNIYCEEFFSSPDRRYFLGVSKRKHITINAVKNLAWHLLSVHPLLPSIFIFLFTQ
jgi:hypothetical protein